MVAVRHRCQSVGCVMSDGLSIGGGGVVDVSSMSLRDAAVKALAVEDELAQARRALAAADDSLSTMNLTIAASADASALARHLEVLELMLSNFASSLNSAADFYEVVELKVRLNMAETPPSDARERIAELVAGRPGLEDSADELVKSLEFARSFGSIHGLMTVPILQPVTRSGPPVFIAERDQSTTKNVLSVVPKGAADLAKSIPTGPSQVQVQRYDMPDGTRRFIVSSAGTREWDVSATEPFDMGSNWELFNGNDGTGAEAIRVAMEDAGVKPGDWVLVNAHSQAAMAADKLAIEPQYDIDAIVKWGDPSEFPVPDDVLAVDIVNDEDLVPMLSVHDYPVPTGSDDSFTVTRDISMFPIVPLTHVMSHYIATGALVDASQDPRVNALTDPLAELVDAEQVTVTDYTLTKTPTPTIAAVIDGTFGNDPQTAAPDSLASPEPSPSPSPMPPPVPGTEPQRGVPGIERADLTPVEDNHAGPWLGAKPN